VNLLIAIPCFNEDKTIKDVISSIPEKLNGISRFDVILIDDGSTDKSVEIAKKMGVLIINHHQNYGVGMAFQSAVNYAVENKYDILVNIDGDGQFNSKEIQVLLDPICKGKADIAIGSRFIKNKKISNISWIKLIGNKIMSSFISKLVRKKFFDVSSGFRAYNRQSLLNFNLHATFTYTQETFIHLAVQKLIILEVPIEVKYFKNRKSRVVKNLFLYTLRSLMIIFRTYRDYFPLRFFWSIASFFFFIATIFSGLFFGHFMIKGVFAGFLFAGFLSAFFYGLSIIFFMIGIVADMLDRIRVNQERILFKLKDKKDLKSK
jgi:glycosyltransferase involved in cell wall biosynthesis